MEMSAEKPERKAPMNVKGDVYLLVADNSPEFEAAMERVVFLAQKTGARVSILYVIEEDAFFHWNIIEKKIQTDKRQIAEKRLWEVAHKLYEMGGIVCGFYIKEGKTHQEITEIINTDDHIRALVLGAAKSSSNPLISYFTGKGLSSLRVPLIIVPEKCETHPEL